MKNIDVWECLQMWVVLDIALKNKNYAMVCAKLLLEKRDLDSLGLFHS